MDPSYNNNFGANGSPMAPISSGGDIILNGGEPEKKPKKGLIIGIVIAVLLVIGGLTAYMLLNETSGQQTQNQTVDVKKAYNSYANYVLSGKDSEEDLKKEVLIDGVPYFEGLSDNKKDEYIEKANKKYETLKNSYKGEKDLAVLKSFYQDYAKIKPLEMSEIVEAYSKNNGGRDAVEKLIEERYSMNGDEKYLKEYLDAEKTLARVMLDKVENANKANCITNSILRDGCYTETEEEATEIENATIKAVYAMDTLYSTAEGRLIGIYEEFYTDDDTEEE